jgi:hypothetical protein
VLLPHSNRTRVVTKHLPGAQSQSTGEEMSEHTFQANKVTISIAKRISFLIVTAREGFLPHMYTKDPKSAACPPWDYAQPANVIIPEMDFHKGSSGRSLVSF